MYENIQEDTPVDVAKYGVMKSWADNDIGVQWSEARDIFTVVVKYADSSSMLKPEDTTLQYWQHNWPRVRVAKGSVVGAGSSGWMSQDDWLNGEWKTADANVSVEGNTWMYTFNPVNATEFPDEDFDAIFRRTLKLRLVCEGGKPDIESLKAYTDSVWRQTAVNIEWQFDNLHQVWDGHLEVYNGEVARVQPLRANSAVTVSSDESWTSNIESLINETMAQLSPQQREVFTLYHYQGLQIKEIAEALEITKGAVKAHLHQAMTKLRELLPKEGKTDGITATIWYTDNEDVNTFDKTIVTVRAQCHQIPQPPFPKGGHSRRADIYQGFWRACHIKC